MTSVAQRPFSEIFGGMPGDAEIAQLAAAAARAGYAVLPIAPGEKTPLCPLTQRQRDQADRHAAEEARDAGRASWQKVRHPCGIEHATTDPKLARRWFRRLDEQHPDVNMAVAMAPSRVLVADCDTAAELASFTTLWARAEDRPELIQAAPTVRSPGKQDEDGHWSHSEGGHFYFLLPEDVDLGDLADVTTILVGTDPEHQAQLKVGGYALVPPSVRAEGPYVMESDAHIAPDWLVDLVLDYIQHRRAVRIERRDAALDADDMIRVVQSGIPWAAILEPRGWVDSGKASRCGCPEWTAPGDHGSPKSATAHDPGCGDFDTPDGFIHIWTDNPPDGISAAGTKTFSKIQFVAWHDHEGDMSAAMAELDIERHGGGGGAVLDDYGDLIERLASGKERPSAGDDEDPDEEDDDEDDEDDDPDVQEEVHPVDRLLAELLTARDLATLPPPVPLVDGLLDRNSLARVVGKSGHGKSFFMIDIAAHVALGMPWQGHEVIQGDVVYMVAEGAAGIQKRVRAWEHHHGRELDDKVKFLPRAVQVSSREEWAIWSAAMVRLRPALIVIDTQARVTAGMNENGPEDMGTLVYRVEKLKERTGACVVLVHHKGHSGDHGRGHSSVIAAADAEIEVTKEAGEIAILSTKQKDQEDFDPIKLRMVKVVYGDGPKDDSVVLLSRDEIDSSPDSPFIVGVKQIVDESSSTRDQVAAVLYRTWVEGSDGATRADVWAVAKDRVKSRGKKIAKQTFYNAWSRLEKENVLLPTTGSRFVLDPVEADRLGLRDGP
jgi:KaiC/GvpD/RAD55 family RecA-like ATPase